MRAFRASTADSEGAWDGAASGRSWTRWFGRREGNGFDWAASNGRDVWLLSRVSVREEREGEDGDEGKEGFELHFRDEFAVGDFGS